MTRTFTMMLLDLSCGWTTGARRPGVAIPAPDAKGLGALREQVANFLEKHFRLWRRRGRRLCGRSRLLEFIDALDHEEEYQGNDDEIKNGLRERAVLDQHFLARGILAES